MTVNVLSPLVLTTPPTAMQVAKLLLESCSVAVPQLLLVLRVTVAGLAARLNVTLIEVLTATPVAPSVGTVSATSNANVENPIG